MDTKKAIKGLNRLLALEYASAIQYAQHSNLLTGLWRGPYHNFFSQRSQQSFQHARQLGEYIAGLGGLPTVEPAPIRQSADLEEMLRQALELERESLAAAEDLLEIVKDHAPLRVIIEHHVQSEQEHIWELEKMLKEVSVTVSVKEIKLKTAS